MKANGLAPTLHRTKPTGLDSSYPIHDARNTRDTILAEILSARHLIGFANTHPDGGSDWIRRSAKGTEQSTEAVRQQMAIKKRPGLNPASDPGEVPANLTLAKSQPWPAFLEPYNIDPTRTAGTTTDKRKPSRTSVG